MRSRRFARNGFFIVLTTVSTSSLSTTAAAPLQRFRLVQSDGVPVPALDEANAQCTVAGWYRVQDNRWQSVDSLKRPNCESSRVEVIRDSGILVRHRDTLSFFSRHAKGDETYLVQRGALHGDSLLAGGFYLDGPPLVYIRVH